MTDQPSGDTAVFEGGDTLSQVNDLIFGEEKEPESENDEAVAEQETVEAEEVETEEETTEVEAEAPGVPDEFTLKELAELIESDPEWLYNGLRIGIGDDAKTRLTLSELKDSWQQRDHQRQELERQQKELEDQRKIVESQAAGFSQVSQDELSVLAQMQSLEEANRNTDWKAYREKDAVAALAYKQDLQDAYKAAEERLAHVRKTQKQAYDAIIAEEEQKAARYIPEWADGSSRAKIVPPMQKLMGEYGYKPQEIAGLADHRFLRVFYDLVKLKGQEQAGKNAIEKVRKAPKSLKAIGNVAQRKSAKEKRMKDLESRAKTTRHPTDQRAAVAALFNDLGIR